MIFFSKSIAHFVCTWMSPWYTSILKLPFQCSALEPDPRDRGVVLKIPCHHPTVLKGLSLSMNRFNKCWFQEIYWEVNKVLNLQFPSKVKLKGYNGSIKATKTFHEGKFFVNSLHNFSFYRINSIKNIQDKIGQKIKKMLSHDKNFQVKYFFGEYSQANLDFRTLKNV